MKGRRVRGTFFAKGKRMYKYPSSRWIRNLKKNGYTDIVWKNGDFLIL